MVRAQIRDRVQLILEFNLWKSINQSLGDEVYSKLAHLLTNDISSLQWTRTGVQLCNQIEEDHATY